MKSFDEYLEEKYDDKYVDDNIDEKNFAVINIRDCFEDYFKDKEAPKPKEALDKLKNHYKEKGLTCAFTENGMMFLISASEEDFEQFTYGNPSKKHLKLKDIIGAIATILVIVSMLWSSLSDIFEKIMKQFA